MNVFTCISAFIAGLSIGSSVMHFIMIKARTKEMQETNEMFNELDKIFRGKELKDPRIKHKELN